MTETTNTRDEIQRTYDLTTSMLADMAEHAASYGFLPDTDERVRNLIETRADAKVRLMTMGD